MSILKLIETLRAANILLAALFSFTCHNKLSDNHLATDIRHYCPLSIKTSDNVNSSVISLPHLLQL